MQWKVSGAGASKINKIIGAFGATSGATAATAAICSAGVITGFVCGLPAGAATEVAGLLYAFLDLRDWNGRASSSTKTWVGPSLPHATLMRSTAVASDRDSIPIRTRQSAVAVGVVCGLVAALNVIALFWPSDKRDEHLASVTMFALLGTIAWLIRFAPARSRGGQ
ncbi:MAG: hypothetical protein WEB78_11570 [Ilumatobacteraceae bacterium]